MHQMKIVVESYSIEVRPTIKLLWRTEELLNSMHVISCTQNKEQYSETKVNTRNFAAFGP